MENTMDRTRKNASVNLTDKQKSNIEAKQAALRAKDDRERLINPEIRKNSHNSDSMPD
jgi:hypothetical protein